MSGPDQDEPKYVLRWSSAARRHMNQLPIAVAAAVFEFAERVLRHNPHRVGKELDAPFDGLHSARRSTFRIIYRINDGEVDIRAVKHRADAYRPS